MILKELRISRHFSQEQLAEMSGLNVRTIQRIEKGCLVFDVIQGKDNVHRFTVYEEFTNRISFAAHQGRVHKSRWGKVTAVVERHYQITDV